jgi:hypothetical protein
MLRGIGKIKPLFTQSHPPASAHPLPPCARWCPRLGSARTPHAARLAPALPGRARRCPHPRRARPGGSQQATGPRRRARPGRRPGSQRGWSGSGGTAARERPLPPLAPTHPVAPAPPPEVAPSSPARSGGRLAQPALAARRRRLALRGLGDGQAAPLGLRGGGLIQTR